MQTTATRRWACRVCSACLIIVHLATNRCLLDILACCLLLCAAPDIVDEQGRTASHPSTHSPTYSHMAPPHHPRSSPTTNPRAHSHRRAPRRMLWTRRAHHIPPTHPPTTQITSHITTPVCPLLPLPIAGGRRSGCRRRAGAHACPGRCCMWAPRHCGCPAAARGRWWWWQRPRRWGWQERGLRWQRRWCGCGAGGG